MKRLNQELDISQHEYEWIWVRVSRDQGLYLLLKNRVKIYIKTTGIIE